MQLQDYILLPVLGFVFSFVALWALARISIRFGYTDNPIGHKTHTFPVAPVGGLSIFIVMFTGSLLSGISTEDIYFLGALVILAAVGAIDEKMHIPVGIRVVFEVIASLLMAFGAGIALTHFGNLLGFGIIYLPWFVGLACTVVAVFGTINAWNMIDGIDGLAGSIALLATVLFGTFFLLNENYLNLEKNLFQLKIKKIMISPKIPLIKIILFNKIYNLVQRMVLYCHQ